MVSDNYDNAMQLLSSADRACEQAHKTGGDQVELYGKAGHDDESGQYDEDTINLIREAITAERMRLLYQPIASFEDGSEERYEVKLEILDANQQGVDMDVIKPIAEQNNLMQPLDRWTIITALSILTEHYQVRHTLATLFIQISSDIMSDKNFINWLATP
jgi:EAL domain-containing protein (putative c-di-GMP-specific phosphodiesterase class I)